MFSCLKNEHAEIKRVCSCVCAYVRMYKDIHIQPVEYYVFFLNMVAAFELSSQCMHVCIRRSSGLAAIPRAPKVSYRCFVYVSM
jgi:hypothetical protein